MNVFKNAHQVIFKMVTFVSNAIVDAKVVKMIILINVRLAIVATN